MVASYGPPKTGILAVLPKPAQRHLALHVGGLLERRLEREVARLLLADSSCQVRVVILSCEGLPGLVWERV